jgi:uncharacterized OB-fold protein
MTEFYLPEGLADPLKDVFGLGDEYWDAARDEKLVVQRCAECRGWQWAPECVCTRCYSDNLAFEQVQPTGTLYAFTRIWHPVEAGLSESLPYIVAVVQLDDVPAVQMIGNLLIDPVTEPTIGEPCTAVFEHHADFTLVQWQPTGA